MCHSQPFSSFIPGAQISIWERKKSPIPETPMGWSSPQDQGRGISPARIGQFGVWGHCGCCPTLRKARRGDGRLLREGAPVPSLPQRQAFQPRLPRLDRDRGREADFKAVLLACELRGGRVYCNAAHADRPSRKVCYYRYKG